MVNKRQMHALVEGRGRPAVILEAGFVNDLRSFSKIQPNIAKITTVVSYDRAGLGLSEPSSEERFAAVKQSLESHSQFPSRDHTGI